MLGLYKMGKGSRGKDADDSKSGGAVKRTMGAIRVQLDITELDLPGNVRLEIPDPNNLLKFNLILIPDSGYWATAEFCFKFNVPDNYPYKPPKVQCREKIYHPNIDLTGNICLNLLREDWRPILTIQQILHGLIFLMLEPNPNDPLNQEAAEVYRNNEPRFRQNVRSSLRGGVVNGERFTRNIDHRIP
uniref:NEDD8-conjugating enzyme Ubc12 n=1 Tax=Hirondellea gigas TaxID=1518452 RepID=A0A6A7G353_9CRUS